LFLFISSPLVQTNEILILSPKYVEFHVKCSYSSIIEPINTINGFGKQSNKIESEEEIDESEDSQSSEMETESEDEHIENTEVISPSVTPVQVNTLPVDVPPVRVAINSRQIKRNTITTNRVEKKNSEENLPKMVDIKCKQTTTVASLSIVTRKRILFPFLNFDYPQIRQFLLRIQSC
jgi:hypothetical protein